MPGRLPVIILTGYLGAGKTTLLNYILNEQRDKKLAVIENEIGEVSIDDQLVEQKHAEQVEELVVLNNGCVCCTIRGDLSKALLDLAKKRESGDLDLDGVLIELTGAADPAPVVQTFMVDDETRDAFYVDNVVTLVDAKHIIGKLDECEKDRKKNGTAAAQIAFSSTVLLNKTDLVDEQQLTVIEKRIKGVNSTVEIIRCQQACVPLDKLFDVRAFNLERVLEEQYMDEEEFSTFYKPQMDNSISNVGVRCKGEVNPFALMRFLDKYLDEEETAQDFFRVKGIVNIVTDKRMFVLQCVHMLRQQSFTMEWPEGERENKMIFIGRNMEQRRKELTDGFMSCVVQPLRFQVGDTVRANTEEGFVEGKVIKQWDEYNAYRIELNDGSNVHAPVDDDCFVKASAHKNGSGGY